MKNTTKKVGQPILIVDAETEPMASHIIFKGSLWYHILWVITMYLFNLLQCGTQVIQQSTGQHAAYAKPWKTHWICYIPNDFNKLNSWQVEVKSLL